MSFSDCKVGYNVPCWWLFVRKIVTWHNNYKTTTDTGQSMFPMCEHDMLNRCWYGCYSSFRLLSYFRLFFSVTRTCITHVHKYTVIQYTVNLCGLSTVYCIIVVSCVILAYFYLILAGLPRLTHYSFRLDKNDRTVFVVKDWRRVLMRMNVAHSFLFRLRAMMPRIPYTLHIPCHSMKKQDAIHQLLLLRRD